MLLVKKKIKKSIKNKLTNFFENFKVSVINHFDSFYDDNQIKSFKKFQNDFNDVKKEFNTLSFNNNLKSNPSSVFKSILLMKDNLKDLENKFNSLQKGFLRIKKCKFNLNFDPEGISRNINLKSTSFINLLGEIGETFGNNNLQVQNQEKQTFINNNLSFVNIQNNLHFVNDIKNLSYSNFPNINNQLDKQEKNLNKKINNEKSVEIEESQLLLETLTDFLNNEDINNISFKKESKNIQHNMKKPLILSSFEKLKYQNVYKKNSNDNIVDINQNKKKKSFLSVEKTSYRSKRSILKSNSILKKISTFKNTSLTDKKSINNSNQEIEKQKNKINKRNSIEENLRDNSNSQLIVKEKSLKKGNILDIRSYRNSKTNSRKSSPLSKKKSLNDKKIAKFSNCFLDKNQLIKIVKSVFYNYNNINRIDFFNNTFDCNVLQTIDDIFQEKIINQFTIDLNKNNLKINNNTKSLVKKLKSKNVIIIL